MGRNSSGIRGGLQPGDATYKGSVGKPEPLVNMKDPALYKATKEAISRYHAVLGVRQKMLNWLNCRQALMVFMLRLMESQRVFI